VASIGGGEPVPVIVFDATLHQAIVNLLNNAADASPEKIELEASWAGNNLSLEVRDHGEGLSQTVMDELGNPFFTTKRDGHGLGFYLAQSVVRRLGGEISFGNHDRGGAFVHIELPLSKLVAG